MKFYVIDPVVKTAADQAKADAFYKSGRAGEGYGRKREANDVKKFFEKTFGIKFEILVEEDTLFD